MATVLTHVFATFITWPVLVIFLAYLIQFIWSGHHRRKVKRSVDISVPFFMAAIYFIIQEIWLIDMWFPITAVFIVLLGLTLFIYWRLYDDVLLMRAFITAWRIHFIFYFFSYIALMTFRVYRDLAG
ncbi:DUF3397 domain-containing protein [Salisediminibacterium beveridgei]|uniref:DUF3397 domain-containing protein n=1 Tax=Salisediminibacterium beveridgei TaxID=632773 RepID=A0A1D7QW92_9BACI|nr:DUF3397 domain-containing protein [Salisediminibacterium beveridgei]AOM83284.1 hypothetical protein BBEV_1923 [Salisediminibacterium beveridgei]